MPGEGKVSAFPRGAGDSLTAEDQQKIMGRVAKELHWKGVFAAAVTAPRKGTQEMDLCAPLNLVDFLAARGVSGVALMGSTGEFLHYSSSDRSRLVFLACKRSRVPVIAGVTHSTFAGTVELATEAIRSGADALLVMPPYFFRYSQADIENFYLELAREADRQIPILLYNIPQFTNELSFDTVKRLLATGLFAGIKDSSGDWNYFTQLLELRQQAPFALVCGNDRILLPALQGGADAVISGCACAIPEVVTGLEQAWRAGNENKAIALDLRLGEFIEWISRFPVPLGVKRAVEVRGQQAGGSAVPLHASQLALLKEFETWFAAWLPQALESVNA